MRSVCVFLVCVIFSGVHSAVLRIDQDEIPGHEGQCYDEDGKTFYNTGDKMKIDEGECAQKTCLGVLSSTGKLRIEKFTCPAVEAGPGCTIVQDPSQPYPKCCPRPVPVESDQPITCKPLQLNQ